MYMSLCRCRYTCAVWHTSNYIHSTISTHTPSLKSLYSSEITMINISKMHLYWTCLSQAAIKGEASCEGEEDDDDAATTADGDDPWEPAPSITRASSTHATSRHGVCVLLCMSASLHVCMYVEGLPPRVAPLRLTASPICICVYIYT